MEELCCLEGLCLRLQSKKQHLQKLRRIVTKGFFPFLVPDCTRKNNLAKKSQKNAQNNWMKSQKKLQIKKKS